MAPPPESGSDQMDLDLTPQQKLVKKAARRFAEEELEPLASLMDSTREVPEGLVQRMGTLGYMGLQVPRSLGGAQLDAVATIAVIEEISRACASIGLLLAVHNCVVVAPILRFGTSGQIATFIPKLASGETIGAFCLTEANAGSDAGAIQTSATRVEGGFLLSGTKSFVTNGGIAGLALVFAKTQILGKPRETTLFIVESHRKGFLRGPVEELCGMRGNPVCSLSFEGCFVPDTNLLGEPGEGLKIALATLENGRVGIAAQALGIAQASLEASLKYAKERIQFGRPIGSFQAIQSKLAEMSVEIEASRLLTYKAARMVEKGVSSSLYSAMAKLFASQVAVKAALEAVQVHGGYGYTKAYPVERYLRDAKATEIYEGTSEIQRLVIYKALNSGKGG